MTSSVVVGQLVSITGKTSPEGCPDRWGKEFPNWQSEAQELSGVKGQVVFYSDAASLFVVATFDAATVAVKASCVTPLATKDISGFDVVIGPASNASVLGQEITAMLQRQGHAACRLLVSPADLKEMGDAADKASEEGLFSRLAAEIEPGYFGRDGAGKTLLLDLEDPECEDYLRDSPLPILEQAVSSVGNFISPFVEAEFGYTIYSKSSSVLLAPFNGDEDDYVSPECENQDAAEFLQMMWRATFATLSNAGPANATLTLHPKVAGEEPVTVTVEPGTLMVWDKERFQFSYEPEGKTLSLISWFLDQPREFNINKFAGGDLSWLSKGLKGPELPKGEPVTVVAMAERYAFGVDEPWKAWMAYAKAGWDTQTRHPHARWDCDMYYHKDADQTTGLSYTCHGGFSDGIELFDCKFFDISPAEAKGMDPTQRQVLEVSYMSLNEAGWTKKQLQSKSANIAVFVGLDKNEWNGMPKDISGGFGAASSANAITANRFNYCLNLKGASMTIDTACSASLVCSHTGKLYLLHKHYDPCEASLVTGVNLSMSPMTYIGCCGAGMHSHLGRCFTYNFSADGYARGEATASGVFKLKSREKEKGDYANLAGSHVNQDGRSASLTAPNGPAQERCNATVLKECGLTPPEVETTECHGTGTSLGDPIEIGAYRKVMASMPRHEPVTITSSKSNIGHCEGSAGISGLLKCVLMCMHAEGTPNVHLNCLNPHLDMNGFPGVITTEGIVFRFDTSYNGVLSFGFGGTNACAELFGENIVTSRSKTNANVQEVLMKKIDNAPAQEVTMAGEDWEDWEMAGPGRSAKPGDAWDITIDDDGTVNYHKKEKIAVDMGESYSILGSFNGWDLYPMDADSRIDGLHSTEVTIGASGSESFQIVADDDLRMTFSAPYAGCLSKSSEVVGPGQAERENSWVIRGEEGEVFTVEFFKSDNDRVSVTWRRKE